MEPITRKEMFLAAAGGQNVETPTPVTREEVFLDEIAKGGGSSLPSTETASAGDVLSLDDNKEPQWAPPSGGGGATIVNVTFDGNTATLDKTWQEIHDAGFCVIKSPATPADGFYLEYISAVTFEEGEVTMGYVSTISNMDYTCSTKDSYPSFSFQ